MQNATEMPQESEDNKDMLPDDIVHVLAANEKYVISKTLFLFCFYVHVYTHSRCVTEHFLLLCRKIFLSDSEEDKTEKGHTSRKKKLKSSG